MEEWVVPGVDRRPAFDAGAVSAAAEAVLPECVVELARVVGVVEGVDPAGLDGPSVLAGCQAVLAVVERVRAVAAGWVGQVQGRRLHRLVGVGSASRWLRQVDPAGQCAPAGRSQVGLGRSLYRFPVLAGRVRSGAVSTGAAAKVGTALGRLAGQVDRGDGLIDGQDGEQVLSGVIGDGVLSVLTRSWGSCADDDPRLQVVRERVEAILGSGPDGPTDLVASGSSGPASQLARLEAALVLLAEHVDPTVLAGALAELVDAVLPERAAAREARAFDRRALKLSARADGPGWYLTGQLDATCGERLHTLLDAELLRDADAPLDTAAATALREAGLDPYDDELAPTVRPRTTSERAHDALSAALGRLLATGGGGTVDKQPVQIIATVPVAALAGSPGALPGRTGSGRTIPHSLVQAWACDGVFTRHTLSLGGKVLADSHRGRTLNRAERRALHTQTGGRCQGAGCGRGKTHPGTVLHPHHGNPHARTGTTSLADTVHLCDRCHAHVHRGNILLLTDGRRLGPNGWLTPAKQ